MDIRERFLRSIEHVEARLLEPLALADAAAAAELSLHYYSRLFRVLTGETFGAYVRRRRLSLAAERLISEEPAPRLIDLALDCQYDSQEAFTRAFKSQFGLTPGAFRASPRTAPFFFRGRIGPELLFHLKEVLEMEPEIREIDAFTVVGMRQRFDHDTKQGIPELWKKFVPHLAEIPYRRPDITFGVCSNSNPADGSFDYLAGIAVDKVDQLPPGLVAETVPRQTYAVFTHHVRSKNLHDDLQPTMRWIWGTWLREAPYEYLPTPDFERYPPEFDPEHGKGFLEICVPVRAKS
jgi:AraC family transcriptional regulator